MKTISKILMVMLALNMATSCKKIKQRKPIIVNFQVINPVTKKGYENIKWRIIEVDVTDADLFNPAKYTTFMEGKTDANGKARIEFKRPMSKKLSYQLDISYGPLPSQLKANKSRWYLEDKTEQDITAYASEKVNFVLHIKNTNCFDANDRVIYKFSHSTYLNELYGPITGFDDIFGCIDDFYNQHLYEDYYPYTKEVTRNGVTTVTYDTLVITTDTDTVNWFY